MHSSVFFALCVALAAALYQVFQRQAAGVNPYLVAVSVSAVAILSGFFLSFFGGKLTLSEFPQSKIIWLYLVLIGFCAFSIDFFTSKAYTSGGSVSVLGPIITSGIVILSAVFGAVFFKEPITILRVGGIALMAIGIGLASWGNK